MEQWGKGDVDESEASDDRGPPKDPCSLCRPNRSVDRALRLQASGATGVEARPMLKEVMIFAFAGGQVTGFNFERLLFCPFYFWLGVVFRREMTQRDIIPGSAT